MFSPSPTIVSRRDISSPTHTFFPVLLPRTTEAPAASTSCPPNTLVVQLATTLVIPDYTLYYSPTPIESFRPTYAALNDGSLLAPPFYEDLTNANLGLLMTGALAVVFLRNIIVSGDYLRRGKVKKKNLFYILFLSQLLAPVAFVPIILSYFTQRISCMVVIVLACLTGTVSLGLLITVILGVKVYKCLNHPRFVPIVLGLFQAASSTVVVFDVVETKAVRRLTGSCIRTDDLRFTRIYVAIQFLESLFICCCFVYVSWRSRGSPVARGRISIQLSMDDLPIAFPEDSVDKRQPTRRGWWDYVPDSHPREDNATEADSRPSVARRFLSKFETDRPRSKDNRSKLRRANFSEKSEQNAEDPSSRFSIASASANRFSRMFPRMELFQKVMKDELLYTTFITSSCVIAAVLSVIGVNFKNGLSVSGWITLNWAIISLLTIHSFGRVVHRHERDALLQHPATCTAIMRAANDIAKRDERQTEKVFLPAFPTPKTLRIATSRSTVDDPDDPFADTQPLDQKNPFVSAPDEQGPAPVASTSRLPASPPNYGPRLRELYRSPSNLPSQDQDFPTSNLGTPVVPLDGLNTAQQRGFSRSWLFSTHSGLSYVSSPRSSYQGGGVT
ncbi:unnamed protein product [Cyclocybe aegerita]|uniref:Uncharacterized protein n=1 Tax=Cyclocybe aegerita TaxID=1973307 RepID=A0A8S0WNE1_CYCAE|nr:unnamed protein product [Cyclocybe aegerita]